MDRLFFALGSIVGLLSVAAGAFGAHALKAKLPADALATYHTAVQYHAWHALGLLGIGVLLALKPDDAALAWSAWLLLAGIALFSGSLYAIALTGVRSFGYATPVGGVAFLGAWAALGWAAWRW